MSKGWLTTVKKAKARAFAAYMETALEEDTQIVWATHCIFGEAAKIFGLSISVNKSQLKDDIIDHFFDYGVQETV